MNTGGFAGKVLFVDLTNKEIREEPLDLSQAEKFIGGLGMTLKIAYDNITPGVAALDPENVIVLGVGPLVGTNLPSTSRVFSISKLPTSNTIGWSGSGGVNFGCQLKNAGFDHVVIRGKADRPVVLKIVDGSVEIAEARSLWGLSVEDTCDALWKDCERPAGVVAIGQGGENRVVFSMAFVDRIATLGRGGLGAVMGSKNLKAIVARGNGGVKAADRKRLRKLNKDFLQKIREYPYLKEWQELGMVKSFPAISRETYDSIKRKRVACVSCPTGCKDVVEIPDGEFKGDIVSTSSVVNLFTPVIYGFKDHRQSIKLVSILDGYGLDKFEFFGVMNFVKDLAAQGTIPNESLDPEIVVDSLESLAAWAGKISRREGLGDVLADGFEGILKEFGEEALKCAPSMVKGMHPYAGPGSAISWPLFGTMELGQVLDPRGPHVGSGGSPTYFAKRPLDVFPRHFERMGIPTDAFEKIMIDRNSPDGEKKLRIGTLLKYSHSWFSTLGSMGICARAQINRFYNMALCAEFYEATTGIKTDLPSLRRRIDRIWTLYRLMNLREGFNRGVKEALPERWLAADGFKDYVTENPLSKKDMEEMIEDYYEEWGWDRKTGIPSKATLEKLGLDAV